MSALAEASSVLIDDRLAKRNAIVLAVAQALAGGNNTVIVATAGIIGSMIAPDKGLATLPISVMVFGMWLGTLPIGLLSRTRGPPHRAADRLGSPESLGGLICCAAVLQGSFWLFLLGAFCCGFYAAGHMSYRFAAADTASDGFKPKAIAYVLAGGVLAGVIGPSIVIFTKDLWQPYLFAATFVAQSAVAALAGLVLTAVQVAAADTARATRPWPSARRDRAQPAIHRGRGHRGRELHDDEPGDDLGAARHGRLRPFGHRRHARHPVARDRHVRAELHHRQPDRALSASIASWSAGSA